MPTASCIRSTPLACSMQDNRCWVLGDPAYVSASATLPLLLDTEYAIDIRVRQTKNATRVGHSHRHVDWRCFRPRERNHGGPEGTEFAEGGARVDRLRVERPVSQLARTGVRPDAPSSQLAIRKGPWSLYTLHRPTAESLHSAFSGNRWHAWRIL